LSSKEQELSGMFAYQVQEYFSLSVKKIHFLIINCN